MSNVFELAVRRDFSRAAATYDTHADVQRRALEKCAEYMKSLGEEARVLDAGCGTGMLAKYAPQLVLFGIDSAQAMCEAARPRMLSACAGITQLPFAEGHFDACVSSLVLQWVPQPELALSEMRRVTKPGGSCIISCLGPRTLQELYECYEALSHTPPINQFIPMPGMSTLARVCGWNILHAEEAPLTAHASDLLALLTSLKKLGAGYKAFGQPRIAHTRRLVASLEEEYRRRHPAVGGLPVTWDLYYLHLTRN